MKAILVVDMPNNCYDCQYCRFDARKYNFRGCILTDTEVQDGTIDICKEVHSCCPLKPMPNKYIEREIKIETERDAVVCSHGITLGHNDVIEELEKPETESDLSTDEGWWRDYMLYEMQND